MGIQSKIEAPECIDRIHDAIVSGHSTFLLTGRSLTDLGVDQGKLCPLLEVSRRYLRNHQGTILVTYSLAEGIRFDPRDEKDRDAGARFLGRFSLLDSPNTDRRPVDFLRSILDAARSPTGQTWPDGNEVRFAFLIRFVEHLAPSEVQTDEERILAEIVAEASTSLAVRSSGHILLLDEGQEGRTDQLIRNTAHVVRLDQPDSSEKEAFLSAALETYTNASLEEGLAISQAAQLVRRTPNREVESLIRASHRKGIPLTREALIENRIQAIARLSEGSLQVLSTPRHQPPLAGRNARKVHQILMRVGQGLATQDPTTPLCVVLVGPPGTGKTYTMLAVASQHQVVAVAFGGVKRGIVGESERVLDLKWSIVNESGGAVLVDEITEQLPLERGDFNGDSGVSHAITARFLTELSNESMRGKRCIFGTTNCPWRMGEAMRDRFEWIPTLYPHPQDHPEIIMAIAQSLKPEIDFDETEGAVQEAARIFHRKAANPREIRGSISAATFFAAEPINPNLILRAAGDFSPSRDSSSIHLADLWAIKACRRRSFLPWSDDPVRYEYPPHIEAVMADVTTGEIDRHKLDASIARLSPHANV